MGVCQACPSSGYAIDPYNYGYATSCSSCTGGQRLNNARTGCEFCPLGQKTSVDRTSCVSCAPGEYASSSGVCLSCSAGQVVIDGNNDGANDGCGICSLGQKPKADRSGCEPCGVSEFASGPGACSGCTAGTVPTASGTNGPIKDSCAACPFGQKAHSSGVCISCASNEYASVAEACATCSAGAIPSASGNNGNIRDGCSSCTGGQIVSTGGASCRCPDGSQMNGLSCELCPAGTAGVGGTCSACPRGKQPKSDRTACVCSGVGQYNDRGFSLDENTCQYASCLLPPGKSGGNYTLNGINYCLWGSQCVSVAQTNQCAGRKITIEISGTDSVCGCDE